MNFSNKDRYSHKDTSSNKDTSSHSAHPEAGMTLFEVIAGLFVLTLLLPLLYGIWDMGATSLKKRQAADHLGMVNKAAAAYVRKHGSDLLTTVTATSGPVLSVSDLINEDLLSEGFSPRNVWLQEYRVYIRKPHATDLQAITLTTGGRGHDASDPAFSNAVIPSTATYLGGAGGYVPTGILPGTAVETLHGAFGGWVLSFAVLSIPSPGPGHLGALATFDGSALDQDFLYRVAVPGHKELNAMQTELDMTDHAIRGVSELQFTPRELTTETCTDPETEGRVFLDKIHGLYLCRNGTMEVMADSGNATLLREASLATNGDFITKPLCAPGSGTIPNILVSPALAAAGYEAPPMTALQAWAVNANDTQWRVYLRLLTTDETLGWVYPEADYGRISVFTSCSKAVVRP